MNEQVASVKTHELDVASSMEHFQCPQDAAGRRLVGREKPVEVWVVGKQSFGHALGGIDGSACLVRGLGEHNVGSGTNRVTETGFALLRTFRTSLIAQKHDLGVRLAFEQLNHSLGGFNAAAPVVR